MLAVALGVGAGFATGVPGVAWADDTDSSSSADSSSPAATSEPTDSLSGASATETDNAPASGDSASPSDTTQAGDSVDDPQTESVQSSGGAQTGSYGPNASEASADDETVTESTLPDNPEVSAPTDTGSPDTPAPANDLTSREDTGPQNVSPPAGNTPAVNPAPTLNEDDSTPRRSSQVDAADQESSINATGEPGTAGLFTMSGVEGSLAESQRLATLRAEDNSALTTNPSLAVVQDPTQSLMAIPTAVVNIAVGFVAAVLSPFLAPGPAAPAQPPLTLFAVLDWLRREVQRTFFNRSPNAVSNAYTTSEDVDLSGNLLTNDTDADGDSLTSTVVSGPTHGEVTLNADGSFTYTPDANYTGTDTFTYRVSDAASGWHLHGLLGLFGGGGHTDTATVTITVTPVNDAPVAANDTATTAEDTQASGNVLTNDSDIDSNSLTASLGTGPANGTAVVNANGTFTYTPDDDFNGVDTFTYTVSDGASTDTGTVTVTVTAVQDAPDAVDDTATVAEDSGASVIDVLGNDADVDGDDLAIASVTRPANGTVVDNGDGTVSYTPDANFIGTDTFSYTVSDGIEEDSATVTVTVTAVNDAPVAVDDELATNEDTALDFTPADLLDNDSDADGDTLITFVQSPHNGSLTANPDGTYTYTPNADFSGTDNFSYVAHDGTTSSNIASVTIEVTPAADVAPVVTTTPGQVTYTEGDPPVRVDDGITVTDADSPTLTGATVTIVTGFEPGDHLGWEDPDPTDGINLTGIGQHVLQLTGTGTPAQYQQALRAITYDNTSDTPSATERQVQFQVTDDDGQTTAATKTIAVTPVADVAPVVTTTPGQVTYTEGDPPVRVDDGITVTDADSPTLTGATVTIVTGFEPGDHLGWEDPDPTDGINLTGIGQHVLQLTGTGTPAQYQQALRAITYDNTSTDPTATERQVQFQVTDDDGQTTAATKTIAVTPVAENSAPVANRDEFSTELDTTVSGNVLTNDRNLDGDALTATRLSSPTHGSLTLNQDGSFTYTPGDDFTGIDSFTYGVSDGTATDTAIVTLTVGDPIAPVPGYDTLATTVNTPLTVAQADLLTNDFSASGNALSLTVTQGPRSGQLQLSPDGSFTYTPHGGFSGLDEFHYVVNDGQSTSAPAVVTIAVGMVANTAPHGFEDNLVTAGNTPRTITDADLVGNDGDNDLDGLTANVISQPANGTVIRNSDGTHTYTPNPNFRGTDTFYYTAFDGQADSLPTLVSVSVDPRP